MNKNEIMKSIEEINKHSASDHTISVIKAILSTAPFCGGMASLKLSANKN